MFVLYLVSICEPHKTLMLTRLPRPASDADNYERSTEWFTDKEVGLRCSDCLMMVPRLHPWCDKRAEDACGYLRKHSGFDFDKFEHERKTPQKSDPINDWLMPCIGILIFWALWYYWGLPWNVIKEILFHDL